MVAEEVKYAEARGDTEHAKLAPNDSLDRHSQRTDITDLVQAIWDEFGACCLDQRVPPFETFADMGKAFGIDWLPLAIFETEGEFAVWLSCTFIQC